MRPPPTRCPLCGEHNACGMAAGSETCWCFDVAIAPEALAAIPAEARGVTCICRACAAREEAAPTEAAPAKRLAILHE